MDAKNLTYTTWGKPTDRQDIRALRRFNEMLRGVAKLGEILVLVLTTLVVVACLYFLLFGDFETVIFTDGTSSTCLFDGKSEGVSNGSK
jgi:hypothetical protein